MVYSPDGNNTVGEAMVIAKNIIDEVLNSIGSAGEYNVGGVKYQPGENSFCIECSDPISFAQKASIVLSKRAKTIKDQNILVVLELAADYFDKLSELAIIKAKFRNGSGTEKILINLEEFIGSKNLLNSHQHQNGNSK